jgi:hypothetical protein
MTDPHEWARSWRLHAMFVIFLFMLGAFTLGVSIWVLRALWLAIWEGFAT